MLDQSFTAHHFHEIFQRERRKGNIRKDYYPAEYLAVLENGHYLNETICELKQIKRADWTEEQKERYRDIKEKLKDNLQQRRIEEDKWLESIADIVNDKQFRLVIFKTILPGGKSGYSVPDDVESLFVMKTLMSNLKRVFKVQQANRHRIMTQVKCLMNENTPKYIIRTDVHHFYESISQDRLLKMIKGNTLLSKMSIRFIWQVLEEYERMKDVGEPKGLGVPRGVGISAYLSEIYMRELDEKIKLRPEVVYYVRYVDDIFMVLSHLPYNVTLEHYYESIRKDFLEFGLALMDPSIQDQREKLQLLDLFGLMNLNSDTRSGRFSYLGYQLEWTVRQNNNGSRLVTSFNLSEKKREKIHKRIDAAFDHFEKKTKYSLSEARRDLRDSLKFIVGNYKLTKSKSGIKAGLYYSNDLLSDSTVLRGLTEYLRHKTIKVYPKVMKDMPERQLYIDGIKAMIMKFNFQTSWEEQKCYTLPDKRIREISQWLSEE